ncbi:MAG: flagellar protein FliS [Lachnospiraceae bacterium]|nr:flagellar protein FliS [Lachnospiraceae bacterium]
MTEELKREYTRKISSANKSQITVLVFEIALEYAREAGEAGSKEEFFTALSKSRKAVEQLLFSLDYNYDISIVLMRIYNYVLEKYNHTAATGNISDLDEAIKILTSLHGSFKEAAKSDDSKPVMSNVEKVYTGLTYSREGINNNVNNLSRGFKV